MIWILRHVYMESNSVAHKHCIIAYDMFGLSTT